MKKYFVDGLYLSGYGFIEANSLEDAIRKAKEEIEESVLSSINVSECSGGTTELEYELYACKQHGQVLVAKITLKLRVMFDTSFVENVV